MPGLCIVNENRSTALFDGQTVIDRLVFPGDFRRKIQAFFQSLQTFGVELGLHRGVVARESQGSVLEILLSGRAIPHGVAGWQTQGLDSGPL